MDAPSLRPLFSAYGIELEYMIVDAESLNVRPIADELFRSVAGEYVCDVERNTLAWSNELTAHVIELKTNGPASSLEGLSDHFANEVTAINELLAPLHARLLPTAMHPWMNPHQEMVLWQHDNSPIYETYHRIFDCRGHGWANLQSMHINLPFADDDEFGRLHAAIRLLLPVLPGLAASSPIMDGEATGKIDSRLEVYRSNSRRVPSVTGRVIPEPAYSRTEYVRQILDPMYAEIDPLDPEGLLHDEFLNSRGAIARFSRNAIEIRVIDVQECPQADLAIAALVAGVLKRLTEERWTTTTGQQAVEIEPLEAIFLAAIRHGGQAIIRDRDYLDLFGLSASTMSISEFWNSVGSSLLADNLEIPAELHDATRTLLQHGSLSSRILKAVGPKPSRERLLEVYRELSDCLADNRLFVP